MKILCHILLIPFYLFVFMVASSYYVIATVLEPDALTAEGFDL